MIPSRAIFKLIERHKEVPDLRLQCRNLRHPLVDVLATSLCAVVSGAVDFFDFELYSRMKESFLRTFLELFNGVLSHDMFQHVLDAVVPTKMQGFP